MFSLARPSTSSLFATPAKLAPGLLLTGGLAALAFALRTLPGVSVLSPMILALLLGVAVHNLAGTPASTLPGITFSLKRLLRLGIVLLGLQLTAAQLAAIGGTGLFIVAAVLAATFFVTVRLARPLGVPRPLAELIAAGTSVCGASAILAANSVSRARQEDVAYAIACITLFGSLSMALFPLLLPILALEPQAYGLWAGAAVHEVAQVVATAFQGGQEAGEFGTVAKLARVLLLAPLILAMGWAARRRASNAGEGGGSVPFPLFVVGFLAMVGVNSLIGVPEALAPWTTGLTSFLLTMALAAMGLGMNIRALRAQGLRPLALAGISWIFVSTLSLALILLLFTGGTALPA
ncbi:YeiH family protein [Geminicoccaceae bacterium 1502E]|nr:YeiH family protein [Geminicoccaceae bacterium 1502E]